jgi:two-component system chemotaxis response regulator CheB
MSADVGVLIADRSPAVRAVLRRLLEDRPGVFVIGESDEGRETARLAAELRPDVVVLDLDLPSLGGRALVEAIATNLRVPIFILTATQRGDAARVAFSVHSLGVVSVLAKPETPGEWEELGRVLVEAIDQMGESAAPGTHDLAEPEETPVVSRLIDFVAVGASTGGPGAIFEMLRALGRASRVGVAVVQHIADGFEAELAEWLAGELGMDVAVAQNGERLAAGGVRLAPPGCHMALDRRGTLRLDTNTGPINGHRPAVDVLFRSLLDHPAGRVAAVLLSGMGSDGAEGMAELKRANILTIAQERRSCAVFGMPRAALEHQGVALSLAPQKIGRLLARARSGER